MSASTSRHQLFTPQVSQRKQHSRLSVIVWKMGLKPRDNTGATTNKFSTESINARFDLPSTKQTALWYHAAAGWPEKEMFLNAIHKGNYAMWPGLTVKMMSRHFPESIETKKGHMNRSRQGS